MEWVKLLGPWIAPVVALGVGIYVGRLGLRAETMRLRHSIAERRVRDFDSAASDLLRMTLGMASHGPVAVRTAWTRFHDSHPHAAIRLVLAAELAMMPAHREELDPLFKAILDDCSQLDSPTVISPSELAGTGPTGGLPRLVARTTLLVHLLMRAVDISTEASLEGRASRRYADAIEEITKRWAENITPAAAPGPGGDA